MLLDQEIRSSPSCIFETLNENLRPIAIQVDLAQLLCNFILRSNVIIKLCNDETNESGAQVNL